MDKSPPVSFLLKAAVERQEIPPGLSARIRKRIEDQASHSARGRRSLAAAGIVACAVGAGVALAPQRVTPLSDRVVQEAYLRKLSAMVPAVVQIGLGDHIHCAIFGKHPNTPPTLPEMATALGPSYRALLPVVKAALPPKYRIIAAHKCGYAGRKFVHLTFSDGADLVSVIISQRRHGETLTDLPPAIAENGLQVYQARARAYQVAAFEAGSKLAFVVSEKTPAENLNVAKAIAPDVCRVLAQATI